MGCSCWRFNTFTTKACQWPLPRVSSICLVCLNLYPFQCCNVTFNVLGSFTWFSNQNIFLYLYLVNLKSLNKPSLQYYMCTRHKAYVIFSIPVFKQKHRVKFDSWHWHWDVCSCHPVSCFYLPLWCNEVLMKSVSTAYHCLVLSHSAFLRLKNSLQPQNCTVVPTRFLG